MQYLRCLLPYDSKAAPQPTQVWVVMARRSSIIGWVCHQDMRQDRLQNLCPRRGWSMACPQCSHAPLVGVHLGCGVMLLRRHHDLIVSRPTPVIAAICPKLAPLSRSVMIFRCTRGSMAFSPSFHPCVLACGVNWTRRVAFTGSGCCHALGGGKLVVITPRIRRKRPHPPLLVGRGAMPEKARDQDSLRLTIA